MWIRAQLDTFNTIVFNYFEYAQLIYGVLSEKVLQTIFSFLCVFETDVSLNRNQFHPEHQI